MTCYQRRHAEPCSRCAKVAIVCVRSAEGPICADCRRADPDVWRPCGLCGEQTLPVTTIDGIRIGSCCYVPPLLRCTVCGIRQGVRAHKTRRPVCTDCAEGLNAVCSSCGLDAARPETADPPTCARCQLPPALPCGRCGAPTMGRDRDGGVRCPHCYERPVGDCGRCGRIRAIVRFARDGDPDLCGVCWQGPVLTCERCGRVGRCRGERRGRMLCTTADR